MNTKILKYELFSTFLLTLVISMLFLFGDSATDSYLSISSTSSSGFFSYYFFSFVNFFNYYTGSWVVILFSAQVLLYVFCSSKRADLIDLFLIAPLLLSVSIFTYFLKPSLMGQGLFQFYQANFSSPVLFLVLFSSLLLVGWGMFRENFTQKLMAIVSLNYKAFFEKVSEGVGSAIQKSNKMIEQKIAQASTVNEESSVMPGEIHGPTEDKEIQVSTAQNEVVLYNTLPVAVSEVYEESVEEMINEQNFNEAELNNEESGNDYLIKRQPVQNKVSEEKYYGLVSGLNGKKSEQRIHHPDDKYFQDIINKIHSKLAEFKIEGRIINILKGPVVDTFEWELGAGEKISKLTSAAEDLSLALLGAPIRMVYPMKGRGTVGIEVPRNPREIIFLDEIISSKEYINSNHHLPLAMGKDAFGEPVVVDLASMPHMLVAGATGAGKSVFINSILMSLLIKRSPAQMKLILVDPKQLELALYARLPHLIMPVITDAKTASIALLWAVQEMERRYSIMTQMGVRNIEGFNHKLKKAEPAVLANLRKFYEYETEDTYELPYIVVIVDEFADLILTASGKDIENNICRLAAKARAAGIHLVIATQRPSVDVITGLIKSNFPTRVSFRVTSPVDSRTILNAMGAEKLLGRGDMLYKYGVDTTRIHSSYVEEEDIEAIADKLAEISPTFNDHVMEFLANGGEEASEIITNTNKDSSIDGKDEKYDEAVRVVIEHRSASASLLQRRLGVGYNRAANLIEEMEANGVVGPAQGSKPRKVLLGSEGIN
jgi:S-DNA-T family DNA segregation ATPase FtsK/SpoIIIE